MNKKVLLCAVVALVVILTAILVACSGGKTYSVDIEGIDGASLTDAGTYISSDAGSGTVISPVKEGAEASYDLILPNYYDPATVSLTVDGQEIPYTLNPNYDETASLTDYQVALTFTVTGTNKNIIVKVAAEERKVDFVFKLAEGAEIINREILADFTIADKFTALEAVTAENGKTLSYTRSELYALSNEVSIKSGKSIGYYELSVYDSIEDKQYNFIENNDGRTVNAIIDSDKHNYSIMLEVDGATINNRVKEVYIYPNAVGYKSWYVNSVAGAIAECVVSGDGGMTFAANENKSVTITLKEIAGVDYSDAKVFVNDTELKKNASGAYVIEAGKAPIEYVNVNESTEYISTVFNITVTGVDMSGAEGVKTFTYEPYADGECKYEMFQGYYYCEGNIAWYTENEYGYYGNATLNISRADNEIVLPSVITITGENFSVTINVAEHLPLQPSESMQAEIYRDNSKSLVVLAYYDGQGTAMSDINSLLVEIEADDNYTVSFGK